MICSRRRMYFRRIGCRYMMMSLIDLMCGGETHDDFFKECNDWSLCH